MAVRCEQEVSWPFQISPPHINWIEGAWMGASKAEEPRCTLLHSTVGRAPRAPVLVRHRKTCMAMQRFSRRLQGVFNLNQQQTGFI